MERPVTRHKDPLRPLSSEVLSLAKEASDKTFHAVLQNKLEIESEGSEVHMSAAQDGSNVHIWEHTKDVANRSLIGSKRIVS